MKEHVNMGGLIEIQEGQGDSDTTRGYAAALSNH